jgi:hypothetical protein
VRGEQEARKRTDKWRESERRAGCEQEDWEVKKKVGESIDSVF